MQGFLLNEQQLLEGIAQNNRKITALVYSEHFKNVKAYILSRGGDLEQAQDVFQEAMTVLFQKAQDESFRLTCKISTYLIAVSKYIWYKKLEHQSKHTEILWTDDEGETSSRLDHIPYQEDIQNHLEKEQQYAKLAASLDRLGGPCSALLKAFYFEQKNMQEIAKRFGYTNSENAKTQKYKCLSRLKKLFGQE